MLLMIILGVAFVVFCVLAFFATRAWQIGHVLILIGLFLFSVVMLVLAGLVVHTELGWRKAHRDLAKKVESKESELRHLTQGPLLDPPEEKKSIPELKSLLDRQLVNRGRVWRGAAPVGATENVFKLNMVGWGDSACARVGLNADEFSEAAPPAEEGAEGAAAAEGSEVAEGAPVPTAGAAVPHGIGKETLLYAFLEYPPAKNTAEYLFGSKEQVDKDPKGFCRLPSVYLGRFRVQESTDTIVTLEVLDPLNDLQLQALRQPTTWALYESLPKDDHSVFEGITPEQLAALRLPYIDEPLWNKSVADYLRDGKLANEGDLPERKRVKIKFSKATTIPVDVEGAGGDAAATEASADRAFDPSGRAAYVYLQQGKPTEFAEGDEAVFDGVTAKRLVANGHATLVDEVPTYRRELRDYESVLRKIHLAAEILQNETAVAQQNAASIAASIEDARGQIAARNAEIKALQSDQQQFVSERSHVAQVSTELLEKRTLQLQELSRLYKSNLAMRRELMGTAPVVSVGP